MAHESLLAHVPIDEANVHPVPVALGEGGLIADEYEHLLRETTGTPTGAPALDLVLLGLGRDGHTASLFPGNHAVEETEYLFVDTAPGAFPPPGRADHRHIAAAQRGKPRHLPRQR
jgi:6-phosphogluconolactonase